MSMERKGSISHAQSSTEGLLPATHRLDLLIAEQRTLVKSAQESLQQALDNFQKSTSKEEQESARMQVHSLLTRAQEMVVTVQIILHIRSEIGHIQKEILNAKERHESTSKLHGRLQWLETHLEKMLMARRRGRPGVHGRRTQIHDRRSKPEGSFAVAKAGGGRFRGRTEPFSVAQSQRETLPSSIGTPSRMENISEYDGISVSQRDTPWKSESTGTSNYKTPVPTRSLISSKHSASRDSDDWHSESEANWTMVGAYSNQLKDITQSQILSEDEKQSHGYSPSWSKSKETPVSPQHASHILQSTISEDKHHLDLPLVPFRGEGGMSSTQLPPLSGSEGRSTSRLQGTSNFFETPRPVEVFGRYSWNSLVLAVNSNLVLSATGVSDDILGVPMSIMLYSGASDIHKDIESLKKLITNAGIAATHPGPLLSANRTTAVRFILNSREKSAAKRSSLGSARILAGREVKSPLDVSRLQTPSPKDIASECSKLSPSRKSYGKKMIRDRSSTYPRYSSTWSKTVLPSSYPDSQQIIMNSGSPPRSSLIRLRSQRRNRISRTASRSNRRIDTGDIFERKMHQEKYVNQLMSHLESSVADVRRDSVQALGMLPYVHGCEEILEKLKTMLTTDRNPLVQYEAFKSLLFLGSVSNEVIGFTRCCLRQGSIELNSDLMQFLCQDSVCNLLSDQLSDLEPTQSALELLHGELVAALKSEDSRVTLPAALLLSRAKLEREECVRLLKRALVESTPQNQSQALLCLVECWQLSDVDIIQFSLRQMRTFHSWTLRQKAVESLTLLDKNVLLLSVDETGRSIYDVLMERLSNEPILAVRVSIRKLLTHLGLDSKAEHLLMGKLESKNEVVRVEAITALSGFDLKNQKNVRVLLECLELDPSTYVRVQVVRLFTNMKYYSSTVLSQLAEKSKGKGPVAKECLVALQAIDKGQRDEY